MIMQQFSIAQNMSSILFITYTSGTEIDQHGQLEEAHVVRE